MRRLKVLSVVLTFSLLIAALTGCSIERPGEAEAAGQDEQITVVLYFSNADGSALISEERLVDRSDASPEMIVLQELIKGPHSTAGRRVLPAEAEILMVEVLDGVAFVDLSQSTADSHTGGSAGDAMTVSSIVYTLTELPGVSEVQLMLEGQVVEAIFGHVATDQPISR